MSSNSNKFVAIHSGGGYSSELEDESSKGSSISSSMPQNAKPLTLSRSISIPPKQNLEASSWKERKTAWSSHLKGMNAYDRHKKYINDYVLFYGSKPEYTQSKTKIKTDWDILREEHRFIRSDEDNDEKTYEKRLAKKYYDKLFKEYCLADMRKYKDGKIGMRWRVESEVFGGKGQFVCGNLHCDERQDLKSFEVNFSYVEAGEKKNALVKLRLCPGCAKKLGVKEKSENQPPEKQKKKRKESSQKEDDEEKGDSKRQKTNEETPQKEEKKEEDSSAIWKSKPEQEKTQDQEFDEFFDGLFL